MSSLHTASSRRLRGLMLFGGAVILSVPLLSTVGCGAEDEGATLVAPGSGAGGGEVAGSTVSASSSSSGETSTTPDAGASSSSASSTSSSSGAGTTSPGDAGGDTEPSDMQGMLEAHNKARASVVPAANPALPPLVWSSTVAAAAQAVASTCHYAHDTDGGTYGQNIYASTWESTPEEVVSNWVSEQQYYDYATNTCEPDKECGHYTQVVWRKSVELGCAFQDCTTGSPFGSGSWRFYVCNYSPPGNMTVNGVKEKPY